MRREIEVTSEFNAWYDSLDGAERHAVNAAVDFLIEGGPGLGRPFVDTVDGSRIANLKELRPKRNDIRILSAFYPRRTAILLIGGSKANNSQDWYERNIPEAERLYEAYLSERKAYYAWTPAMVGGSAPGHSRGRGRDCCGGARCCARTRSRSCAALPTPPATPPKRAAATASITNLSASTRPPGTASTDESCVRICCGREG
jgi:hypothetical protein